MQEQSPRTSTNSPGANLNSQRLARRAKARDGFRSENISAVGPRTDIKIIRRDNDTLFKSEALIMLTYQATDKTVNLSFSKEFLSAHELTKLIEMLRVKELISKSQMTDDDASLLDNELKENWWRENQERFLAKIK